MSDDHTFQELLDTKRMVKRLDQQFVEYQKLLPASAKCAYCKYPLKLKHRRKGAKYCDIHCQRADQRQRREQAKS